MAKIVKKTKASAKVPECSTSDIAFLLLIFFIVSTVFVKERGLKVTLPKAEAIEKIVRNNAVTLYVDKSGQISIDDYLIQIPQVEPVMMKKLALDFNAVACFRTDKDTQFGLMADIINQLRNAQALRVSFEAKLKQK